MNSCTPVNSPQLWAQLHMRFLFFFIFLSQLIFCYEELYDQTKHCTSESMARWDPLTLTCMSCTYTKNNIPLQFLLGKGKKSVIYSLRNTPDDDSSVLRSIGVDIEYFEVGGILNQLEIYTDGIQIISINPLDLSYSSFEYSNLVCPGYATIAMKKISFIVSPSSFDRLQMTFLRKGENHLVAISKMRIWVNCMTNCEHCYNYQKCLKCMPGYNLYTINDSNVVCETNVCSISNCDKCPYNMPEKCLSCKVGYEYDAGQNICINQSAGCGTDQYFDVEANGCVDYSQKCYYYSESLQEYEQCQGIDITQYRCPQNTFILFFDYLTNGSHICGCTIENCESCTSFSHCIKCKSGTEYNQSQNKCQAKIIPCSVGFYYFNGVCVACDTCTSNSCCDGCSANRDTKLSIYDYQLSQCVDVDCNRGQVLDTVNRMCVCKIANCVDCFSLDYCDECLIGYQFNTTTKQCEIKQCSDPSAYFNKDEDECIVCGVKCAKCNSNACEECVDTTEYLLDLAHPKNCKRKCGDFCEECTLDKVCTKCIDNSYIISDIDNTICKKCNNCSYCDQVQKKCTNCIATNYYQTSANPLDCAKCDTSCSKCTETECQICAPVSNHVVKKDVTDLTKCITCGDNCTDCDKTQCFSCKSNAYYIELTQKKNCIACELNCTQCDLNTGLCQLCNNGPYFLYVTLGGDKRTCGKCNDNCNKCDESYCQECKNGYYRNPLNNFECIPCELNCQLCSDIECTTCKTGFYKNIEKVQECRFCGENCDICDVPNSKCSKCKEGYYINPLKIDECLLCGDKCKSCSSATACDECISNIYYQKPGENVCIPCEANCETCSQFQCETCISNLYRRDKNNVKECIVCDTSCNSCDNSSCLSCKEQYAVPIQSDPQICRKCISNCAECDANVQCIRCNDGYYLNGSQICVKCEANCNKCTQTQCTECAVQYYQDPAQITNCLLCGTNCLHCNETQCTQCDATFPALDQTNLKNCVKCGTNCAQCDFLTGQCEVCTDTAIEFRDPADKRNCRRCGNNCSSCDHQTANCIECYDKYYTKASDQINCLACGLNCLACDELGCTQCPLNYSKDPVYKANCISCGQNCKTCDFETNQCSECLAKHSQVNPDKRDCLPCGTNCNECDDTQCLKCIDRYYPALADKKNCLECGSNCLACDGIKCTNCNPQYPSLHLTNKMDCVKCDVNCKTCNLDDSTCTVCQDGYYQNPSDHTQCLKCGTNCLLCSTSAQCDTCSNDYPSLDPDNKMNCIKCDANCVDCNLTNNECNQCVTGFYTNPANHRVCLQCGDNCNKCSGNIKCDECNLNYPSLDPLNNMNCIKCDENCSNCNYNNNECITCKDGYYINSANHRVCLPCGTNCLKCSSSTKCDVCDPIYPSLDPNNNMDCIKCDDNCLTCNTTNNQCTTCKDGYYINPSNPRVCLQCGTNCNKCSGSTVCDECHVNYPSLDPNNTMNCIVCGVNCKVCNISSPKCIQCNDSTPALSLDPDNKRNCKACGLNCTSCDFETGVCNTCEDGYYKLENNSANCTKCGSNCLLCNKDGCTKCDNLYPRLDPNNKLSCLACESNCQECNISQPECITCKPGYPSLDQTNKANCVELGQNCLQSDFLTAQCTQCKDSTYFKDPAQNSRCRQCGSNCFQCDTLTAACTKCNVLHYMKSGNQEDCFPCGQNCKQCTQSGCIECITKNTYVDPNNSLNCKICEENCVECDNNKCTLCKTESGIKYFNDLVDPKKCRTCKKPCLACNELTAECTQCPVGTYINPLNKEECLPCSSNCSECTSQGCTKCLNDTFYVNPTNTAQCIPCEKGCLKCAQDKCTQCIDTVNQFVDPANQRQCRSCNTSCSVCFPNSPECQECPKGSYKNLQNTEECLACPNGCAECTQASQCNQCVKSNQYFSTIKNECVDCSAGCLTCTKSECTQCSGDLFQDPVDKTKCRACGNNCKKCNKQTAECLECNSLNQYILQNKMDCQQCSQSECSICVLSNNKEQCNQCKSGYFIENGTCKQCDASCLECDSFQCTKCPDGYTQNSDNLYECIICGSNCSSCNRQYCKECSSNEYLVDMENRMNCIKCDPTCEDCTSKTCVKCKNSDKFFVDPLNLNRCVSCSDSNCAKCNTKKTSECLECNKDYFINGSTKQCQLICKTENCQKCQSQSSTLCEECKSGYSINSANKTCSLITDSNKNNFSVTNSLVDDGYLVTIQFSNSLVLPSDQNLNNLVNFQIQGSSSQYTYQLLSTKSNQLVYKITPQSNIKNSSLQVKFTNNKFMSDNAVDMDSSQVELKPYVVIPQSQKAATESVQSVGDKVSQAASSSILPLSMIGNFYIITNTIDYTGFLYFLLFTKIRFPGNVLSFYSIFENFQFPFIPNLFKQIVDSDYIQISPKPFMEKSTDAYFLNNAGQSMTIITGVISVYVALKLLSFIPIKYVQPYLKKSLSTTWEYSAFFDMVWTVYIYVLIGSYLQFYSFDTSDSGSSVANYILFAAFNLMSFGFPFFVTYLMYKQPDIGSNKAFQTKFHTILGGLNIQPLHNNNANNSHTNQQNENDPEKHSKQQQDNHSEQSHNNFKSHSNQEQNDITPRRNFQYSESGEIFFQPEQTQAMKKEEERKQISIRYSKYYYPVLYFRKALFGLFIVYFSEYPIMQLVLISGLSVGVSFYIWFIQPFSNKLENIKAMTWEYLMVAVYMTAGFLIEDKEDQDEEDRFKIGWVIIAFTSVLLGINTAIIIYDLLKSMITPLYNSVKKLFKSKKVTKPMEKYQTPSTNNLILDKPIITQTQITNQLPPTERSNIFQKQNDVQPQQQPTKTIFQRTRLQSIDKHNENQQEQQEQMSENFSFQGESVPSSQKQIKIFDIKPNTPSQMEILRSHSRLNSLIPFNQHQDLASQNPSQKTPLSPTSINVIQDYSKTHNRLMNDS